MKRGLFVLAASAAGVFACAWYLQASRLYINGNLASAGVIQQGGNAYVPVKDVAQALHLTVQKTARGYELSDVGGADQIGGVTGKVGDTLWNGFGRFQVAKVIRTKNYTNQFSGDSEQVKPNPKGYDLVVLVCHIKNGTKVTVVCSLPGGDDTALPADSEHNALFQALGSGNREELVRVIITASGGPFRTWASADTSPNCRTALRTACCAVTSRVLR